MLSRTIAVLISRARVNARKFKAGFAPHYDKYSCEELRCELALLHSCVAKVYHLKVRMRHTLHKSKGDCRFIPA